MFKPKLVYYEPNAENYKLGKELLDKYRKEGVKLIPIENHNKPLTSEEQTKYRRISIAMSLFWSIADVFSYFFAIKICTSITVTAFFITLLMIIGEYGKGGKDNAQE